MAIGHGILSLPRDDTIVAISTPPGRGALGIIRLSGKDAINIAGTVCKIDITPTQGGSAKACSVEFGDGIIDTAVITVWRAPRSFSGENMVEFTIHGSPFLLCALQKRLIEFGARPSAPGEFTLRALLNGKLSLASAGAIDAIINATGRAAAMAASKTLSGELTKKIESILVILENIELKTAAQTEFPENIDELSPLKIVELLDQALLNIQKLIEILEFGEKVTRESVIVIAGPPNVGKSTLTNALLGTERSIVHHKPGTTRDLVEDKCHFGDIEAILVDTAGLRETEDEVELIGVNRSCNRLSTADLVVFVLDGSSHDNTSEVVLLEKIYKLNHIIVLNKHDLGDKREFPHAIRTSALTGDGIDKLREKIKNRLAPSNTEALWAGAWQIDGLDKTRENIEHSIEACHMGLLDAALEEISSAIEFLREISGQTENRSIIEKVLEGFCLGK
ncbi:tRNA uridine-5-carboxymethylaminomethyl(34) synthesis GTPase MnmE [bacterium]|nr:tRNA uridine-5-carboxymethylaminomethyl(34) synthesis GTPase MnmE [bacterium]